jgi:hypothetical protein
MAEELRSGGLVGEQRAAKLIYLVLVSRFLERPLCAVIKGLSSAGKNFVTASVLCNGSGCLDSFRGGIS